MRSPTSARVALLLLLICLPGRAAGQTDEDLLAVEVAAARAMLARRTAQGPVGLDPGVARQGHAPGPAVPGWERPRARSKALAQSLGTALGSEVRVLRYAETRRCPDVERIRCPLEGVAVHLTLSAPLIDGDTALVTVTLSENTGGTRPATQYETVRFTLRRTPSGWIALREEQLGVSE